MAFPSHGSAEPGIPEAGLVLWLRAGDAKPDEGSQGVAVWKNRVSGSPHHANQDKAERRPKRLASVEALGGQAAIEFDGVDDFLDLPWLEIGTRATVILVAENAGQTEGGSYWRTLLGGDDDSFRAEATKYALGFRRADQEPRFVANLYYAAERSHRLIEPAAPRQQNPFHIYSFRRDGPSERGMTLRVDGGEETAVTAPIDPPGFPGTGYTIGQGGNVKSGRPDRFYRGRIAEILIYNRALEPIEILKVEEYLAETYKLWREVAPPTKGLTLWLEAESAEFPGEGSGRFLWRDQSGGAHPAAQFVPDRIPLYRPRAMNGRAALDFVSPSVALDFGGWKPPAGGSVFSAQRSRAGEEASISREAPAIDSGWGGETFSGTLAELLVYDSALSSRGEADLLRYLKFRYSESRDRRNFENGRLIFRNGYNDQPYLVRCQDGSWLCVITTSAFAEHGDDRTLVVTRSRDQGKTWSPVRYAIEAGGMRQPSWATLFVAPYGRVYVFYNLREHPVGQRSRILYVYKYSDDHGETWSQQHYRMPVREIALDREFGGTGGWSVCPPIEIGSDVFLSCTRYAPPGRHKGQGFVFRSANLLSERDPEKIQWEMLPPGDRGIRAWEVESNMQEEHIVTPLAHGDLFCIWRTENGSACQSYSRDGGRTWENPGPAVFLPGGRPIKNPLACCRPFRTSAGLYLLWFHNTGPATGSAVYRPRDVVWLAGGREKNGVIHWSQPEVFLYGFDLPVNGIGMSYPDFIEEDGRFWVTTTDKEDARIFEMDPALLEGLWNQGGPKEPPRDGLILETHGSQVAGDRSPVPLSLPDLLHGGFTVDFMLRLQDTQPGQALLDWRSESGAAWSLATAENGTLRIELDDGRNPPESWTTAPGTILPGLNRHLTFIVDGGPDLILVLVDGVLCDGGEEAMRGWGRFSRRLMGFGGEGSLRVTAANGSLRGVRVYDRPLRVSEAVSLAADGMRPRL